MLLYILEAACWRMRAHLFPAVITHVDLLLCTCLPALPHCLSALARLLLHADPHHSAASPPAGSSPRRLHAATAAAMAGSSSPLGAASTPGGSMSVGPQSCSRSQLSGFTLGTAHGPGGGAGRHAEMHEVDEHGGVGAGEDLQQYGSEQPACGCRCVIS